MTQSSATLYASALADVVTQADTPVTPEQALGQLRAFSATLGESRELRAVLGSPVVSPPERRSLLKGLAEALGLAPAVRELVLLLVDHRRIAHFAAVQRGFERWLDAYRNRVAMQVRVARPLSAERRADLEARFRELTGKDVRASYIVERDLIGGSSVRIGSLLFDGSLRSALESLSKDLAAG